MKFSRRGRPSVLVIALLLCYPALASGSGTADGADVEQKILYRVEIALLATSTFAAVVGAFVAVAHLCVGHASTQAAALAAAAPTAPGAVSLDPIPPADPGQVV